MTLIGARYTEWSINLIELTPDDAFQLATRPTNGIRSSSSSIERQQSYNRSELATANRDKKTRIGYKDGQTFWHSEKLCKFLNWSQFIADGRKKRSSRDPDCIWNEWKALIRRRWGNYYWFSFRFFPALRTPCCLSAKLESLNIIDGKARSERKKEAKTRYETEWEKPVWFRSILFGCHSTFSSPLVLLAYQWTSTFFMTNNKLCAKKTFSLRYDWKTVRWNGDEKQCNTHLDRYTHKTQLNSFDARRVSSWIRLFFLHLFSSDPTQMNLQARNKTTRHHFKNKIK